MPSDVSDEAIRELAEVYRPSSEEAIIRFAKRIRDLAGKAAIEAVELEARMWRNDTHGRGEAVEDCAYQLRQLFPGSCATTEGKQDG